MYLKHLKRQICSTCPTTTTIDGLLSIVKEFGKDWTIKNNKKITYYDIPCAFDIETSSFYDNGEKVAIMYEWTFALFGYIVVGRTWDEFIHLCREISEILQLNYDKRLVVYVHNLSYEFQFMRKLFDWERVFSLDERKPIEALTTWGICFRCSYKLSGYSLERLGNQLLTYKVQKLSGSLRYDLIRHSGTPLTAEELHYCYNDVLVVICYIQELIEREGNITKIPLTKTGFVRNYCRKKCLYEGDDKYHTKFKKYRDMMKSLVLTSDVYSQLKKAFAGGFTHANAYYVDEIVKNVSSFDFTSSYPYVMIAEKFPMSPPQFRGKVSKREFKRLLKTCCCLFDVEFTNIKSSVSFENYISQSHCHSIKGGTFNNGRVVSADLLRMTVTEQDYMIIRAFYKWDNIRIGNLITFTRGYLPTDFVLSIVDLYEAKTTLKGVEGKEPEYLRAKEDVNSCFGMTVTDICRDDITYFENEWGKNTPEIEEAISKNNKTVRRFLYYPWGVWVTAYARANLFTGIYEFKDDYVYSDTDSIKVINVEEHREYFEKYNALVDFKLNAAAKHHGISVDRFAPKTIEGKVKKLGVWDYEGTYELFKTLGAKRYMYKKDGEVNMTVAGVNKKIAVPYLIKTYGDDIFKKFNADLYIPAGKTGKSTHTYIDVERNGIVKDYMGNIMEYHEESGIHLEDADYSFSMTEQYIRYLLKIKEDVEE